LIALTCERDGFSRESAVAIEDPQDPGTYRASVALSPAGALTGTVFLASGKPAAGALVVADTRPEAMSLGRAAPGKSPRAQTVVDNAGRYSLLRLAPGDWFVGATTNRTAWSWTGPVLVRAPGVETVPDIVVAIGDRENAITGVVLDTGRVPVPGAVLLYGDADGRRIQRAVADREGRFSLEVMESDREFVIQATDPAETLGVGTGSAMARSGDHVEIEFRHQPIVELRVRDSAGNPIPSFNWKVGRRDERKWGGTSWLTAGEVEGQEDGAASFTWTKGGELIEVNAAGYQIWREAVVGVPRTPLNVELRLGYRISGKIVGVPAGVHRVLAMARPYGTGEAPALPPWNVRGMRSQWVTEPWEFNFPVAGPGMYAVAATGAGLTPALVFPCTVVSAPGLRDVVLEVGAPAGIAGVVKSGVDDTPSSLELVLARGLEEEWRTTRPGVDGHFFFRDLPDGTWWLRVRDRRGGRVGPAREVSLTAGQQTHVEIDLRLAPAYRFRGRILLGGKSFAEGIVSQGVSGTRRVQADWVVRLHEGTSGEGQELDRRGIGTAGSFVVESSRAGAHTLVLSGDAGHGAQCTLTLFDAPPSDPQETTIDLEVGRVVLHGVGIPLERLKSATIEWVSSPDSEGVVMRAQLTGRFASNHRMLFPNVPVGDLTIGIPDREGEPSYPPILVSLAPGQDRVVSLGE
jgi:hypothetical protein